MDKQIRYLPDYTAVDNSNLVRNEPHKLANRRFKCMTLTHGSFYAESLLIKQDGTNYELRHNKDYVFSDIDVDESAKAGEPVANVIIVLNNKLGRKFKVTYRAVGLPIGAVNESTVRLLDAPEPTELSDSYLDVRDLPEEHKPTFHYHSMSEVKKFEYMLFCLEKIRISTLIGVTTPIRQYLTTVELIIQSLTEKASSTFDAQLIINFRDFKKTFTRESFGVDKIHNWGLIDEQDTDKIANRQNVNTLTEGYLAMSAFVKFKNSIYENYLGSDLTQLGRVNGIMFPPALVTLTDMAIGATIIFDTYNTNVKNGVKFDRMAYPSIKNPNSTWSMRKITNSPDKKTTIIVATEMQTHKVYTGILAKSDTAILATWKELIKPNDIDKTMKDIMDHAADDTNPHQDDAASIDLERVENLPPVNDFDIITDSNARKMLTWEALDKITRRYLLKNRPHKTEQLQTVDENLMRNISVVFSPCGTACGQHECKTLDQFKPVETTTTTTTTTSTTSTTTTSTTTTTTTTKAPEPEPSFIGIFAEGYTNQTSIHWNRQFSVSDQDGSTRPDDVLEQHPTYYDSEGNPLEGDDIPDPSWSVGQGWKHMNVHVNAGVRLVRDERAMNQESIDFYSGSFENSYKFLFRPLVKRKTEDEELFFRMKFEIIGTYPEFDVVTGPRDEDILTLRQCQDFGKYTPVTDGMGDLPNGNSVLFQPDDMDVTLMAEQYYRYLDDGTYPTDIGIITIVPQMFTEFFDGAARMAARAAPTPYDKQFAGYIINSRKGQALRIRMHIHRVDKHFENDGEIKDLGRLGSLEFTLATYLQEAPFQQWETEKQGIGFQSLYALLNIVPVGFTEAVHHEHCVPQDHEK